MTAAFLRWSSENPSASEAGFPSGRAYLGAVVALFAVAWAVGVAAGPYVHTDVLEYLYQAENLEAGRPPFAGPWDATPRDPTSFTRRPPGYAAVLVALRAVTPAAWWLAAVQSALGVATWWMVWAMLARVGAPRRAGPLVAGLLATPATLVYAQMAMADTLFTALFTLAAWRFVAFVADGRSRDLAAFHGVLAAALWVKPVVLYLWPATLALAAWALWRRGRRGARLWPAALAGLVPLAALGLSLLNASWTGHREVTSMGVHNLVHQNAQRTLVRTGEAALHDRAEAEADRIADYGARQTHRQAWAARVILDRPAAYAAVHATGMAAFVFDPGRFDLALFLDLDSPGGGMTAGSRSGPAGALAVLGRQPPALLAVLAALLALNAAVAVAFLAWLAWGAAPPEVRVLALVLVGYTVAVTGPVGSARYRMAVAPLVALALPWAWDALRSRLARA